MQTKTETTVCNACGAEHVQSLDKFGSPPWKGLRVVDNLHSKEQHFCDRECLLSYLIVVVAENDPNNDSENRKVLVTAVPGGDKPYKITTVPMTEEDLDACPKED